MLKLGWNMIRNRGDFWVQVMRAKYKCRGNIITNIAPNRSGLNAWNGIKEMWLTLQDNLGWRILNGVHTKS